ncbi:MAG: hypothetical protein ACYDH4_10820 [Candidatus Cryosericum sp.]
MIEPDDQPRHMKRASHQRKRWGVERWNCWFKRWFAWKWYPTEAVRDQALADLEKHTCTVFRQQTRYRKIER